MSESPVDVRISAEDRATPVLWSLWWEAARDSQIREVRRILGTLPTILHNRLSDDSRDSLATAFVASMEALGYRIEAGSTHAAAACPACQHPHLDYADEEPCVSCGCAA